MLHRITAISILAILLLNLAGRYPAFKISQWQTQRIISLRIENLLSESELKLVSVKKNSRDIEWIRSGKEFKYKGQLYDLVRSEEGAGTINYYCIQDDDETELEEQYDSFAKAQHDDHSSSSNSVSINVLKILFSLIYIPQQDVSVYLQNMRRQQYSIAYCCYYSSAFTSVTGPPPKGIALFFLFSSF